MEILEKIAPLAILIIKTIANSFSILSGIFRKCLSVTNGPSLTIDVSRQIEVRTKQKALVFNMIANISNHTGKPLSIIVHSTVSRLGSKLTSRFKANRFAGKLSMAVHINKGDVFDGSLALEHVEITPDLLLQDLQPGLYKLTLVFWHEGMARITKSYQFAIGESNITLQGRLKTPATFKLSG